MCFSAEADLAAGMVVLAIGIDAVRHVTDRREVALASLPVLLGIHQLTEVFVWLALQDQVPTPLGRFSIWSYLIVAFVILPVVIPLAVLAVDPSPVRKLGMLFVAVGIGVAAMLSHDMIRGPVMARIVGHHIEYRVDVWNLNLIVGMYVVATCGSLLRSRSRHVRWFGMANVVAATLLAWLDQTTFVSLWCLWAAVGSAAIATHLRLAERTFDGVGSLVHPFHGGHR